MMPMFNQGSWTSALLGVDATSFASQGSGFTYNDSPYVHALNRALQLEQAAIAIYATWQRDREHSDVCRERTSCHHHALRELVRMIFAQQALPDPDPTTFTAFTSTMAARAARWMPGLVQSPVLGMSAHRVEDALGRRYQALLKLAPAGDHESLRVLLEQSRDFSREHL